MFEGSTHGEVIVWRPECRTSDGKRKPVVDSLEALPSKLALVRRAIRDYVVPLQQEYDL